MLLLNAWDVKMTTSTAKSVFFIHIEVNLQIMKPPNTKADLIMVKRSLLKKKKSRVMLRHYLA
jgi:hypothetical protein